MQNSLTWSHTKKRFLRNLVTASQTDPGQNHTNADLVEMGKNDDMATDRRSAAMSLSRIEGITANTQVKDLHLQQSRGVWVYQNLFPKNSSHLC